MRFVREVDDFDRDAVFVSDFYKRLLGKLGDVPAVGMVMRPPVPAARHERVPERRS